MNLHDTIPGVARGLRAGLSGDPDQRAVTELLITAVNGVWLTKLGGWTEYLRPIEDTRRPGAGVDRLVRRHSVTRMHCA